MPVNSFKPVINTHFGFVGCFVDNIYRDLPNQIIGVTSKEQCYNECSAFRYFSVQGGKLGGCFCGHSFNTRSAYIQVPVEDCKAGKDFRNAVYGVHPDTAVQNRFRLVANQNKL